MPTRTANGVLPRQKVVISWAAMAAQRRAMNISQRALADAVGVHPQTIYRIEKGTHRPTVDVALAICRALGVPLTQIMEATETADEAKNLAGAMNSAVLIGSVD